MQWHHCGSACTLLECGHVQKHNDQIQFKILQGGWSVEHKGPRKSYAEAGVTCMGCLPDLLIFVFSILVALLKAYSEVRNIHRAAWESSLYTGQATMIRAVATISTGSNSQTYPIFQLAFHPLVEKLHLPLPTCNNYG